MMHVAHQQLPTSVRRCGPGDGEWSGSALRRVAELGVLREMKTGRIDVRDILRLGFKLARRCGVPLRGDGEVR